MSCLQQKRKEKNPLFYSLAVAVDKPSVWIEGQEFGAKVGGRIVLEMWFRAIPNGTSRIRSSGPGTSTPRTGNIQILGSGWVAIAGCRLWSQHRHQIHRLPWIHRAGRDFSSRTCHAPPSAPSLLQHAPARWPECAAPAR